MKKHILLLLGAFAGGLVGYFGFLWIARQGFYALVLPGGLLGVGASLFRNKSTGICILCGLVLKQAHGENENMHGIKSRNFCG